MESLELNKVAGAILTAGIVASVSGFVAQTIFHREHMEKPAYVVAGAEGGGTEAKAPAKPKLEPVVPLLASADIKDGESISKKCHACHSLDKGGPNKIGPHLWGVVGRPIASIKDFSYSDALKAKSGETWTYANLNHFVHKPKEWVPGTKMGFAGLPKVKDRANLIAYLRTLSDNPVPLPTPDEVAKAAQESTQTAAKTATEAAGQAAESASGAAKQMAAAGPGNLDQMIAAASVETGEKKARVCKACHTFDEGGPNRVGPNLHGVVGRPIASHAGFSYSDSLKEKSGETWTDAHLNAFLTKPKDFASGTKMGFAGFHKEEDRVAVIAYLRSISPKAPPLSK